MKGTLETDQRIAVSYRMTVDEFLAAQSCYLKYTNWKSRFVWLEIALEIPVMAFVVYFMIFSDSGQITFRYNPLESIVMLMLGIVSFIFIFIITPLYISPAFNKWLVENRDSRRFLKGVERDKLVQMTIDANSIVSQVESLPENSHRWDVIIKVVRTPEGFLFWLSTGMGPWIPNHALVSGDEAEALAHLARQCARTFVEAA